MLTRAASSSSLKPWHVRWPAHHLLFLKFVDRAWTDVLHISAYAVGPCLLSIFLFTLLFSVFAMGRMVVAGASLSMKRTSVFTACAGRRRLACQRPVELCWLRLHAVPPFFLIGREPGRRETDMRNLD